MFPEYRELISKLKGKHSRFSQFFEKHNKLDHEIKQLESMPVNHSTKVTLLKLEKLEIKREIQKILEEEAKKTK
ncbi:DUF465 domain-containing protein [Escherichia marmotae]|nr:DUF465 domain-containing protein [Escherichia marmotae]